MKEGVVESIRLHAHKLLQGVGGSHMNAAAIHARLDNMGRRWDHLQTLATERYILHIQYPLKFNLYLLSLISVSLSLSLSLSPH